jgi:CRP-like cAMP-binding protein
MTTETDSVSPALFEHFVPLSSLRPESQASLAQKSAVAKFVPGDYLFRIGEAATKAFFLISGEIALEDASGKPVSTVRSGDVASVHRLAHHSPRKMAARCAAASKCLVVDESFLDVMLTWEQTGAFELGEVATAEADSDDWMIRMLQMPAFQSVPPSNLQAMFMRMQPVSTKASDVVIRQDDEGAFFYVVMEGRCMVTREAPNQRPVRLAELGPGACFGEESLISGNRCNATVTMLTGGRLMRLAKEDFQTLLKEPILHRIAFAEARQMVAAGRAQWLDVRLPTEAQARPLPGSINVPLFMLRAKLGALDQNKIQIVCCDSGRRSSVGAFILAQKGYTAYVLEGGVNAGTPVA